MRKTTSADCKIAIIEDDRAIRDLYKMKLELEGFQVFTATNGVEGLALLEQVVPDVVLLDLRMPKLSGNEMLLRVRQTDWGIDLKVVILTNISKDEAPSILRMLHVDRYIVKAHYTPAQVVQTVREVLGLK